MKKKTIWITGVSSGLGSALVYEFAQAGHVIAGCARREDKISSLASEFGKPHFFTSCDVARDASAASFCEQALAATSAPDLVISNAAIINKPAPLWEIPDTEFDQLMQINVSGTTNILRHVIPILLEKGTGVLVNLSSGWGRSTAPEVAPYCASKWAIEGLTQSLAQELPQGIAAIAMNPGVINTDMLQTCWREHADSYQDATSWARTAAPFLLKLDTSNNGHAVTAP